MVHREAKNAVSIGRPKNLPVSEMKKPKVFEMTVLFRKDVRHKPNEE